MANIILVVDDEEAVLALVAATLADDDRYSLLLASNGKEAVEVCERARPDLLFLDIMMPDMDGYEVCRLLREDPSTADVRIIMLTALAQDFDRRKAVDVGADEYMIKPFSPAELLERVEQVLGAVNESEAGES